VVEDVHQIIANLKTLTLSLADDLDEAILRISKSEVRPDHRGRHQDQSGVRVIDIGTTCSRCRTTATSTSSCT
jgi:DNA-directed RNA polymerase subunit alpha